MFGKYRLAFVGPSSVHPGQLKYAIYVDGKHEGYKTFAHPQDAIEWLKQRNGA